MEEALRNTTIYKTTTNDDLVVPRRAFLYSSKFVTYHDYERDKKNKSSWILARQCELNPKSVNEISTPYRKVVRPPGTWTVTATFGLNVGNSVNLVSGKWVFVLDHAC